MTQGPLPFHRPVPWLEHRPNEFRTEGASAGQPRASERSSRRPGSIGATEAGTLKACGCNPGSPFPYVLLVVFDFLRRTLAACNMSMGGVFNPGRHSLRELALGCLALAPSVRNSCPPTVSK